MRMEDIFVGQHVMAPMDSTDVGTVQSIDEHDGIVYVMFPIPGPPGRTDIIDMDPGDLEPAP